QIFIGNACTRQFAKAAKGQPYHAGGQCGACLHRRIEKRCVHFGSTCSSIATASSTSPTKSTAVRAKPQLLAMSISYCAPLAMAGRRCHMGLSATDAVQIDMIRAAS